ncbi:MAG: GDP-L-fucose synthase [Clostridiales bacterium]|jgi:GDP-L-fucose synthase|nr:GDP-L-fucose synthase [Clostridiales bacterium]
MNKTSKIYVAGHSGLVGSALMRKLQSLGYRNLIVRTHDELDLTRQKDVEDFFVEERPEYVFLVAARAGGILANITYPADFIYQNLSIQQNVIHSAAINGCKKLLFVASAAVYSKDAPQPISEDSLLKGELDTGNAAYGLAKIIGIKLCEHYRRQYATDFISLIPNNMYGFNDHYDPKTAHVLPANIRKFYEGVRDNTEQVIIWGTGNARREFLHADDFADACVFLMNNYDGVEPLNVGTGTDISMRELAEMLKKISGYTGKLVFDTTKPEGVMQRLLDCSRLVSLGWKPQINNKDGIRLTYQAYAAYAKKPANSGGGGGGKSYFHSMF